MKEELPKISVLGVACCGCGACAAACPKACIRMEPDEFGFLRPGIDASACVGCGRCEAACPCLREGARSDEAESVHWAASKDHAALERSSSGGVFQALARSVLAGGGIVVGAAWDEGCRGVTHTVVDNRAGLDSLMRSKYVQSSVPADTYHAVREAIRSGRQVLFCGTACQVAGLKGFLGPLAASRLLLSVDVICHGVPSPGLWGRWLGYVEESEGAEIDFVNFRSKSAGWLTYSVAYCEATEKVRETPFGEDWYMKSFLSNASLRSSCFSCPAKRSCESDITLGDFWGFQAIHPEIDNRWGISAVVCNTPAGEAALEAVADGLE